MGITRKIFSQSDKIIIAVIYLAGFFVGMILLKNSTEYKEPQPFFNNTKQLAKPKTVMITPKLLELFGTHKDSTSELKLTNIKLMGVIYSKTGEHAAIIRQDGIVKTLHVNDKLEPNMVIQDIKTDKIIILKNGKRYFIELFDK